MCVRKRDLCFYSGFFIIIFIFVMDSLTYPGNTCQWVRTRPCRAGSLLQEEAVCHTAQNSPATKHLWLRFGTSSPCANTCGKCCCFSFEECTCENPLLQCRWCLGNSRVCFSSCPCLCLSFDTEKPPPAFRRPCRALSPGCLGPGASSERPWVRCALRHRVLAVELSQPAWPWFCPSASHLCWPLRRLTSLFSHCPSAIRHGCSLFGREVTPKWNRIQEINKTQGHLHPIRASLPHLAHRDPSVPPPRQQATGTSSGVGRGGSRLSAHTYEVRL